ncbi:MAG TPA: 3-hydroxyacyl-CoA dehydrogenase NAD-binding domain-containing protein [Thermodesulfobacteriota bacterium]|nr:3-hydroxyacyl-CoA dehydrogenase NAD-binding domain-containing protein [Thermodesulfobacteriota bacterium]
MKFKDVSNVAMIGSGTMGAGMSWCFAQSGYNVKLHDVSPQQLERACARLETIQKLFVEEGLVSAEAARAARGRIATVTRLEESLDGVQYVLEAVPERLSLKQQLFTQFEGCTPDDAILATNTSGLRITDIAAVCRHPERVGGMHWANPAEIVPLVEVIRGERTSNNTVDVIYHVAEKLGKTPVVVNKDIPGFVSNRLQYAVFREALHLVETGVVSAEDVDRTLKCGVGFRYPWLGPLETADLGGLDVFHGISQYLFKELSNMTTSPVFFDEVVREGKLGIKSGQGFYDYQGVSRDEVLRKRDLYFIRQLKLIREVKAR